MGSLGVAPSKFHGSSIPYLAFRGSAMAYSSSSGTADNGNCPWWVDTAFIGAKMFSWLGCNQKII